MTKIVACCGLICSDCNAYKATVENNDELRKKTAEEWSKSYDQKFGMEDIHCLGCHSNNLFWYCASCGIRNCNKEKGLSNCTLCTSFPCEKVGQETRERLEQSSK